VNSWWATVRNWQWKQIRLKVQEEEQVEGGEEPAGARRFTGFQEVPAATLPSLLP
jgi:hypothetical protein